MASSLVIIDSRVDNYPLLVAALSADTDYFIVNPDSDGLRQIANVLEDYSGLSSISIISHGSPGSITIGQSVLDTASLSSYTAELSLLGTALQEKGDLLLYGCDVGSGREGREFVEILSELTGADVAASDDTTGGFAVGGDWKLEVQSGAVEQPPDQFPAEYTGTLGDETGVGLEFRVNTYTERNQWDLSVSSLADGGFVVTWMSDGQDGSGSGIYGQRYHADGTAAGDEFLVNTEITDYQSAPSVSSLADGGFVVTWGSWGQDGSGPGIYGQRYHADGTPAGDEFRVNTETVGGQSAPSVSSLADGGFVVTWQSDVQDGSGFGIYGQRYDADGAAAGDEFRVNTETTDYQSFPSVTSLADGGFVVTWESYGQDGSGSGIYGQRYHADGTAAGDEFRVNTETTDDQSAPSVSSLADGGFVVTWRSHGQDGSGYGIYGQRYHADGTAAGDEFQINSHIYASQSFPSVSSFADGGFVVTWSSIIQDGSGYGVYGQRYDADGIAVAPEFQINSYTDNDQGFSSVSSLADGGFVVTWLSDGQDGSGYGVYGQRYDVDGSPIALVIPNEAPTLTSFEGPVQLTNEESEVAITFADLIAQGDESDSDGSVVAFKVSSVASGILRIGADEASAQPYDAETNNLIDELHQAYWTPAADATGELGAFSVVAVDDYGAESSTPVEAVVEAREVLFGTPWTDVLHGSDIKSVIDGQGGDDTIYGHGDDDLLIGGQGSDRLMGGEGNDVLIGDSTEPEEEAPAPGLFSVMRWVRSWVASHNDMLYGGEGDDTLIGGEGHDVLVGGLGADQLTGGSGFDLFRFDSREESLLDSQLRDIITDFTSGQDRIDLSGIDANSLWRGDQSFARQILQGDATTSFTRIGQLRFDSEQGILYGNTDNDLSTAEFAIELTGVETLNFYDVVL